MKMSRAGTLGMGLIAAFKNNKLDACHAYMKATKISVPYLIVLIMILFILRWHIAKLWQ